MGQNEITTTRQWQFWLDADERTKDLNDFLHYAVLPFQPTRGTEFSYSDNAYSSNNDWVGFMTKLGVNVVTIAAIMDPAFTRIRLTQSARYWILDTIYLRFRALQDLSKPTSIATERYIRLDDVPTPRERNHVLWKAVPQASTLDLLSNGRLTNVEDIVDEPENDVFYSINAA